MTVSTDIQTRLARLGNTLRIDSIEATTAAGSGHPTSCMSAADLMAAVFFHAMRWDPKNPRAENRDRFVLSKGHAAPVLYAALKEAGAIPDHPLTDLRQWGSPLEGHPTPHLPWIDVSTGSLGQGLSAGLGMAMGARIDKAPYRVFVLIGDGEAAEGNIWEAVNLAGHDKVDNLVAIFDINRLGQSDPTMLEHHVDLYGRRLEAFGWDVQTIDGHDMGAILRALDHTQQRSGKPFAIVARTEKGKGVALVEGKNGWHGKPFKKGEETEKAIQEIRARGTEPGSAFEIPRPLPGGDGKAGEPGVMAPPTFKPNDSIATREAYGAALVALGAARPEVVALDADVKNSTFSEKFKEAYPNRFIDCFIAEQNMVAMAAGLGTCGKIPFASTFACFLSRAYDQVRMGGISMANMKLVGSHAGVSIGEDGPSQMALEDLAMFRAIPGGMVLYPSDATSTWKLLEIAAAHPGIVFMRTSRPKTPVIYGPQEVFQPGSFKVFGDTAGARCVVIGAGVTLHEARKAQLALEQEKIPVVVVDLYCLKPLDAAALSKLVVLCGNVAVTVEDHYPEGGLGDAVLEALATTPARVFKVAVHELPRSGKPEELLHHFGLDADCIAAKVKQILS